MKRIVVPLVILLLAGRPAIANPVCAPWGPCIDVPHPSPSPPSEPRPDGESRPTSSNSSESTSSSRSSEAASGSSLWSLGHVDDRKDAPWTTTTTPTRAEAHERAPAPRRSAAYAAAASTRRGRSAAYATAASTGRAQAVERRPPSPSRAAAYRAIEAAWRAALEATGLGELVGVGEPPSHGTSALNVEAAVKHLRDHSGAVATGSCAARVREALGAGKIKLNMSLIPLQPYEGGQTRLAKDYGPALKAAGFVEVAERATLARYRPKAGDVVVFGGFSGHEAGHMAMYDGEEWVSDFKQGSDVKRPHDGDAGNGFYVNNNDQFVGQRFVIYRP